MRRSLVYSSDDTALVVEVAQAAERAGAARFWTTEDMTHDGLLQAAVVAARTETIGVGTGIAYAFTRNPAAAGVAARTLAAASGGRFTLGLGAGTRGIRRRFGEEFDHPAPRLVEYAEVVRRVWEASGAVSHHGTYYDVELPGWRRPEDDRSFAADVYGSGLNPTMTKYAARGCDGVALHPMAASERYLDDVILPAVAAAGEDRRARLAGWCITSVDADADVARRRVARSLAFYFSTPSYQTAARGATWESTAATIAEAFRDSSPDVDWLRLAELVTEEMLEDLAVWGTPETVTESMARAEKRLASRGFDEVAFQAVSSGDAEDHFNNAMAVAAAIGNLD